MTLTFLAILLQSKVNVLRQILNNNNFLLIGKKTYLYEENKNCEKGIQIVYKILFIAYEQDLCEPMDMSREVGLLSMKKYHVREAKKKFLH